MKGTRKQVLLALKILKKKYGNILIGDLIKILEGRKCEICGLKFINKIYHLDDLNVCEYCYKK